MTGHLIALAWVLGVAAAIFGLGWSAHQSWASLRRREPPEQPADPPPLPSTMTHALPRAGRFDADWWPDPGAGYRFAHCQLPYGPFPADTGPLLHLSEKTAANVALERDIEAMCAEAEAKIPPRWRS